MPYWWEYENDLVGDRSDEPRLPAHQVRSLYGRDRQALADPARRRAWDLLIAGPGRARPRSRRRA